MTSPREGATGPEETQQKFRRLADEWYRDTRYSSVISRDVEHPAYREIVGMGEEAIVLLLGELRSGRGHWFYALREITGEQPEMAPEHHDVYDKAVEAWLRWGAERGYVAGPIHEGRDA